MPHRRQEIRDRVKTLITPLVSTCEIWRTEAYTESSSLPAANIFDGTDGLVDDGDEGDIPYDGIESPSAYEIEIDLIATGASGEAVANALDDLANSVESAIYGDADNIDALSFDLVTTEKVLSEPEQHGIIGLLNMVWVFNYEG